MQRSWLSTIMALGLVSGISSGAVNAAELSTADLRDMEQLLAQLNFDPGAIDGEVDDRTRTAIRLYQEFAVLPVNGEPSANLLRELRQVSQVYTEMREAPPPAAEPEPEITAEVAAETETTPTPPASPEPEIAEPEPAPTVEADTADALPEAAPQEPEPLAAAETLSAGVEAAAPDVAEAAEPEPTEAAPEPAVAESAAPATEPEPEPELEPEMAEPVAPEPQSEEPEAVSKVAEPVQAPEAAAGFNLAGMIARLKQQSDAETADSSRAKPTVPVTATGTTDRASYERTLIWKVQQELQRIGLDPGAADGNMRTRTTSAIATYQRARGLPADGRVSEELLARLKAEAPPQAPTVQQPQSGTVPLESIEPQAVGIGVAPSNGYQAFGAGYGAARTGDYGAAVKLYDQAIEGGDLALEHLAAALYNRANAYQYLGVLDKAIEDYSAAIANKPGFPAAYYNRGFAFDMKGEKLRAVGDFRKARDLGLQRLGVRSPDLPPPLR